MSNNGDCTELYVETLRFSESAKMPRSLLDRLVKAVSGGSYATLDELEEVDELVSLANDRAAARAIVESTADALLGKAVA